VLEQAEENLRNVKTRADSPLRSRQYVAKADSDCIKLGFFDADFPQSLREIPDPPLVLYVRGNPNNLHSRCIAIVGARRCTRTGAWFAENLAHDLSQAGLCVVSGLALGIDAAAHRGCVRANGRTVAFLGAGLNKIYPAMNQQLALDILRHQGTLVSEYPADTTPRRHHFPERNRLLSGASSAVVVVEASTHSGSLISARLALEQGRDVFAVPGPVHSLVSAGCHRLLQQGAGLITSATDVLQELGLEAASSTRADGALDGVSSEALQLHAQLSSYPMTLDEISAVTHEDVAQLLVLLSELELVGIVSQGPSGYIRTS
jgi:DNA processing protein